MTNFTKIGIIGAIVIAIMFGFYYMSVTNGEMELRTKVEGKQKVCEANFDKMWKIISGKAGVATEYKKSFKEVYTAIMEGRYKTGGGEMMKWIQERNPDFDSKLYSDISRSIEDERTEFFVQQSQLIDMNQEHTRYVKTKPRSIFFSETDIIQIKVITSEKTEDTYKTGQENDGINPFGK